MSDKKVIEEMRKKTYEYRKNLIDTCYRAKGLHIGGDMSCAEGIITCYFHAMNVDPKNPKDPDRDRFILSKGHASAALYIAMAMKGYFDVEEVKNTYKGWETRFGAHPCKAACPELDSSSGSLGHGLAIATGCALAARLDKKSYRTFSLMGDGECAEGEIWEAALEAANLKLGNLVGILDRNMMGLDGFTEEIMKLGDLEAKFREFGWNVISVEDGNDIKQVVEAFDKIPPVDSEVPTIIVLHTVKGKGVSFMENIPVWHHRKLEDDEYKQALQEVEEAYQKAKED